jgi:hypothetical protein
MAGMRQRDFIAAVRSTAVTWPALENRRPRAVPFPLEG